MLYTRRTLPMEPVPKALGSVRNKGSPVSGKSSQAGREALRKWGKGGDEGGGGERRNLVILVRFSSFCL